MAATAALAHHKRYKHQHSYSVSITDRKTGRSLGTETGIVGKKTAVAIKRRLVAGKKRGSYRVEAKNITKGKSVKL